MILTKSAENSTIEKSKDIIRYVVSDCYMPAFNQQVSKQGRVTACGEWKMVAPSGE